MKGKSPDQSTLNLFEPVLRQIVKPDHPLTVLANIFPWNDLETEYSPLYSDKGAPAKPVRLMAGLLMLKHIFNGSDEGVVTEWVRDPYFQYFCGGSVMVIKPPCDPSDLARFRKRIGKERLGRLLDSFNQLQVRAGMGKIKVRGDKKPGQDNFLYSYGTVFYADFLNNFRNLKGMFSGIFKSNRKTE